MTDTLTPEQDPAGTIPYDLPDDISVTYSRKLVDSYDFDPSESFIHKATGQSSAFNSSDLGLSVWSIKSAPKEDVPSVDIPSDEVFEKGDKPETEEVGVEENVEYKLIRLIGSGGFGEVYEAVQSSLERVVAVKKLHRRLVDDPEKSDEERRIMNRNFKHEALTTANLDHPNILAVHDLGMDEAGSPVMAMKRVRGKPWHEIMVEDFFNMSPRVFLTTHIPILIDVCQAVAFAHSRGVVHRDIKPQQVMVGEFGEVLLMDWGLAVVVDTDSLLRHSPKELNPGMFPNKTTVTNPAGTVAFMAPEQTEPDANNVDKYTDIYLLGGVLYCLITGELPHRGKDPKAVFKKAQLGVVQPPAEAAPNRRIPPMLADLAMKAMDPDPTKRIATVEEFKDKLNEFLSAALQREESLELVEQAEQIFEQKQQNYQSYGDALNKLTAAEGLWRTNPAIVPLRDKISRAFTRLALSNRDLVLARMLAGGMEEGPARTKLEGQIAQIEVVIKKRIRQRNFAIGIASLLLVAVIIGGTWFSFELAIERDRARAERDAAETARSNAQQLVNFMVNDLQENLELLGQLKPMATLANGVQQYFENFEPDELTPAMAVQQVEAFKNLGLLQLKLGNTTNALNLFQQYRLASTEWRGNTEAKGPWIRRQSEGSRLIASVLLGQGDADAAEVALRNALSVAISDETRSTPEIKQLKSVIDNGSLAEAVQAVEVVEQLYPNDRTWLLHMSEIYEIAGRILQFGGTIIQAEFAYQRELDVLRRLESLSNNNQDKTLITKRFEVLTRLAQIAREDAEFEDALLFYQQAWALIERAAEDDSEDIRWGVAKATTALQVGQLYSEFGRFDEAHPYLGAALSANLQLTGRDPSNMIWQEHLLDVFLALATTAHALEGGFMEARSYVGQGLSVANRLARQDNSNAKWKEKISILLKRGINWEREYLLKSRIPMDGSLLEPLVGQARELIKAGPHRAAYLDVYYDATVWFAAELLARGETEKAESIIEEALTLSQQFKEAGNGLDEQFSAKMQRLMSERARLLASDAASSATSSVMAQLREEFQELEALNREVQELEVVISMGQLARIHEGDLQLVHAAIAAAENPAEAMNLLGEALDLQLFDEKLIPVLNAPLAEIRKQMPEAYERLIDQHPILLLAERGF